MRFTASVVGRSGRISDRRPILPGNFIRMDDNETFRVFFENDWDVCGSVTFVYDGNVQNMTTIALEPADMFSPPQTFIYKRTEIGSGRLLEFKFTRDNVEPYLVQYMLINNDYHANGHAVCYGDVASADNTVTGLQNDPSKDPDRHMWAFPR